MMGNSGSHLDAALEFLAKLAVTLILGTVGGCTQQSNQQTSAPPVHFGGEPIASNESSAAEAWDESDEDSPLGLTIHHHHHFAPGPPGSGDYPLGRLSAAQFDRANHVIHWPPLLRDKQFSEVRYKLDQLFDQRKPGNSGMTSENYQAINEQCQEMLGILGPMMNELHADEFVGATRFIKGLEDEARFPAE